MDYLVGIDVGASTTKAVIINKEKQILGYAVVSSGADFKQAAEKGFQQSEERVGKKVADNCLVIATGYGRRNVPFAQKTKTEISCHAKGSYFYYPRAHTLIDIGGQDSKIIRIDNKGKRIGFKMNRKCAAGTGAFLEEIARRLEVDISQLNDLAEKAERSIQIGSYCTEFLALLSREL